MFRAFGELLHNILQHDTTMLQDAALKCCVRLAEPLYLYNQCNVSNEI